MNALERVVAVLHRARIDGGWDDEEVAICVLTALGLDENGIRSIDWSEAPTSSNLGHG